MRFTRLAARGLRIFLMSAGACSLALAAWLMLGGPVLIDRWLVLNDRPVPSSAIVCLGGGFTSHDLPGDDGWQRVYTAVQLHADHLAPVVIFSGGGTQKVSEAEIYSEAAEWLGLPHAAVALDPFPGSTADHPRNLLKLAAVRLQRDSALLVVTSPLHARRTALCFRKAGYANVRVVTVYTSSTSDPRIARDRRVSVLADFHPSGKRYDDPLNRLTWGLDALLTALREIAAIAAYKIRGEA